MAFAHMKTQWFVRGFLVAHMKTQAALFRGVGHLMVTRDNNTRTPFANGRHCLPPPVAFGFWLLESSFFFSVFFKSKVFGRPPAEVPYPMINFGFSALLPVLWYSSRLSKATVRGCACALLVLQVRILRYTPPCKHFPCV